MAALLFAVPASAAVGFAPTGNMAAARQSPTMSLLLNDRVLVAGGGGGPPFSPAAELYDAGSGTFIAAPGMTPRGGHTASVLESGDVLITGGGGEIAFDTAELYHSDTGTFTPTGSLTVPRRFATATVLRGGRVLVAGGHRFNFPNSSLASAELYDPGSGSFGATDSMDGARQSHTATLLLDGRVLVVGGYDATQLGLATAEIYNPFSGTFAPTDLLASGRGDHTATLLPDGRVLIAGGFTAFPGPGIPSTEIYDPATDSFTAGPNLSELRGSHSASSLPDGRVLLVGGFTAFPFLGTTLATSEIFDPATDQVSPGPTAVEPRGRQGATALANGTILLAGGLGLFCCSSLASAEIFSAGDSTPPVITVPPDLTVNSSGPGGAVVLYSVSALDDVDGSVPVTCTPPSGGTFAIGTTTISCSATDAAGNTATESFIVHVKGAPEQLADLTALVDSYELGLLGAALHDKLVRAQGFLAANKPKRACEVLDRFLAQVKEQRGKRISVERADRLTADARRIKAVIGC